jgi:hypothetical protein
MRNAALLVLCGLGNFARSRAITCVISDLMEKGVLNHLKKGKDIVFPGFVKYREGESGNGSTGPAPLIACQNEECNGYNQENSNDEPLKGPIVVIGVDTEDDLNPIIPHLSDHEQNPCDNCHARFKPETPS